MAENEPDVGTTDGAAAAETDTGAYGPYYQFFYKWPVLTFSLPLLMAVTAFYLSLQVVLSRVKGRKYRFFDKKLESPKV